MNKLKNILKYAILAPAIVYLFMSMIVWNFRIFEWHWVARAASIIWMLLIWDRLSKTEE